MAPPKGWYLPSRHTQILEDSRIAGGSRAVPSGPKRAAPEMIEGRGAQPCRLR